MTIFYSEPPFLGWRHFLRRLVKVCQPAKGGKRWQKVAKGGAWIGGVRNGQISGPETYFQGLNFPVSSPCFASRNPLKFQALKSQTSGPEIWRIHPPPLHTPPFACLVWRSHFAGLVFEKMRFIWACFLQQFWEKGTAIF